jgi:retron-type reverse transcriptase
MGGKSALSHVASVASLNAAFSHIYSTSSNKSRDTSGVDHQTLVDFRMHKDDLIKQLSTDLVGKRFKFSKLSAHFIKKTNGKYRVICVPTVRDRVVQRALLDYLSTRYEVKINNPISYGFLRDKGVQQAAEQACRLRESRPWVFKTDITAFFDKVDRDKLKAKLKKLIREPSLLALLEDAIGCEIFIDSNITKKRVSELGIEERRGIRQGMPMSPFLSNVMLRRFDKAVLATNYKAVRYADDLIFFGSSEHECNEIYKFCEENLRIEGLAIPALGEKSKSQIYTPDIAAEFLGLGMVRHHDLTYRLEVTKEQAVYIRTELFKLTDLEHLNKQNIDFFKFGQSLNSRISGYVNAYLMCSNLKELENKLESIRLRVYSTVLSNLGIKPAALSPSAKKFFRLVQ